MFLINPIQTWQGSLYGQQYSYIDTLVATVWVVGICMHNSHNSHGFLLWYLAQLTLLVWLQDI